MTSLLKSSFLRRFTGGFVLGMIGVFAFQPAGASRLIAAHLPACATAHR